ncbi:A/G-specific adenine glycosylase [Candidatus Cyanaurora vandensis]|uniref:A/G-specific adenine glycosylase n=1 Tax=Candidatus Cyanaurora vandensis TaxID=2714958 RepID=UPI00257B6D80|nr:A/G-specific adenine glycosylase [Candidatus Cyanaurora vandensis]
MDWRQTLLAWYLAHRRDLPWRRDPDPYRVWLAEVMLQQTRVSQMLPYFERFLVRFPTLADLAQADLNAVLQVWVGLGYYGRARNLHRTAQQLAVEGWPQDYPGWRKLPGVGDYTGRAVASVLLGLPLGAVDGNIRRVYSRFFAQPVVTQVLADQQVDPKAPGDFNQALMDLGATVCIPRQPKCPACPLQPWCQAYQQGRVTEFPPRKPKPPVPERVFLVLVAQTEDGLWVRQRPAQGLLGGLWELPNCVVQEPIQAKTDYEGLVPRVWQATVKHQYTHFHANFQVWQGTLAPRVQQQCSAIDWVDLDQHPFSKGFQRVLAAVRTKLT